MTFKIGLKTSASFKFLFVVIPFLSLSVSAQEYQRYIVNTLASPAMEGRGYVNKGVEKAADFIRFQFDSLGLQSVGDSYFQRFDLNVNYFPGEMTLTIGNKTLTPGQDYIVDPHSGGGMGNEFSLKEVNIYKSNQLKKLMKDMYSLTETVLLIAMPDTLSANGRMLFMQTVFLLCEQWPVILTTSEKLTWSVANNRLTKPLFILNDDEFSVKEKVSFEVDAKLKKQVQKNVIGIKKSTNPNARYFVVSAHYDHLGRMGEETYFPGANDNASGVAELLALASTLDSIPMEHHVVYIAFAGEEAGLVGSEFYVNNPLFPLGEIDFLLNLDLSGTGDEGITVVNGSVFTDAYSTLLDANDKLNAVPEIKKRGPAANSDHYFFYENDVPSFFIYTRGGIKAYHDIYDKAETLPLTKGEDLLRLYTSFFLALDKD